MKQTKPHHEQARSFTRTNRARSSLFLNPDIQNDEYTRGPGEEHQPLHIRCLAHHFCFGCGERFSATAPTFFCRQSPQNDTVTRRVTQVTVCAKFDTKEASASSRQKWRFTHLSHIFHWSSAAFRSTLQSPPFPTAEAQSLVVLGAQHLTDKQALAPPQGTCVLG